MLNPTPRTSAVKVLNSSTGVIRKNKHNKKNKKRLIFFLADVNKCMITINMKATNATPNDNVALINRFWTFG